MSADAKFGSRHEHWHPGESPDYLADAIQRVHSTLEDTHMSPDTFSHAATRHGPAEPLVGYDTDDYQTWQRTYRAMFPVGLAPATAYREPRTRFHRAVRMEARRRMEAEVRAVARMQREAIADAA